MDLIKQIESLKEEIKYDQLQYNIAMDHPTDTAQYYRALEREGVKLREKQLRLADLEEELCKKTSTVDRDVDLIVWDLETSGLNAPQDKILEIGVLIIDTDGNKSTKHWVLNNNIDIPEKITEITGITKEIIDSEGRDPAECLLELLSLFKKCRQNITHNGVRFDIPFLVKYASDVLKWTPAQEQAVTKLIESTCFDTAVHFKASKTEMVQNSNENFVSFAKRVMDNRVFGVKFNLGLCADEMGVDRSNVVLHRALGDVSLTYELYKLINK